MFRILALHTWTYTATTIHDAFDESIVAVIPSMRDRWLKILVVEHILGLSEHSLSCQTLGFIHSQKLKGYDSD